MNATGRWYVVQTHPHAESRAMEQLRQQGFVTYLPKLLKQRRHARKVETVIRPLFPRYLFVLVDITTQRWRAIHSTIGVLPVPPRVRLPLPTFLISAEPEISPRSTRSPFAVSTFTVPSSR